MKKLTVLLAVLLAVSALAMSASAAAATGKEFKIPYAVTAPEIDGVIDDGEWDNALVRKLDASNVDEPTKKGAKFEGATFQWMWDDAGIYFVAEVKDTTPMATPFAPKAGSYNSKDGVQVCIYGSPTGKGSTVKTLLFYSFAPTSTTGEALIGEHFCYGTGSKGADVPANEGAVAATYSKTGYVVEGFIAKEGLAKTTPAIAFKEGTLLPLANIVLDEYDGKTTAIFTDTAWFDANTSNKYVLTKAETAGFVPEETKAPTAAATMDPIALLAAAAVLSGAVVVSKKRK
nr:hypothetical protein [Clostridia bacterium]